MSHTTQSSAPFSAQTSPQKTPQNPSLYPPPSDDADKGSVWGALWALLRRDIILAWKHNGSISLSVSFFILCAMLFVFGIGASAEILTQAAAGIVWVCALLATLLTLESVFHADVEDGSIDVLILSPVMLEVSVLIKALAHWLTACVPLMVTMPAIALMLGLPIALWPTLFLTMALGTPALSLIGMIGAALAAAVRKGGLLIVSMVAPLYLPTLLLGTVAVRSAMEGYPPDSTIFALGATSLLSAALAPFAAAAALRLAMA